MDCTIYYITIYSYDTNLKQQRLIKPDCNFLLKLKLFLV